MQGVSEEEEEEEKLSPHGGNGLHSTVTVKVGLCVCVCVSSSFMHQSGDIFLLKWRLLWLVLTTSKDSLKGEVRLGLRFGLR